MLTEELMRQVRRLQIATRRAVNEDFAGEYSSAFKGRGMEFAEVREYQPGDDVRAIDWNVTARTGAPFVKQFVEERELTVIFAVDLSASGRFGSVDRVKNRTAAELCAVLAFAATRNNDKTGLLIFTDDIELFIPPKKGSRHVLRLIRELLDFEPARLGTNPVTAMEYLAQVLRRRAVIFFVSDFMYGDSIASRSRMMVEDHDDAFLTALRLLNRRHDVIALRVLDPRERVLPRSGLLEVEDAESGERRLIDTGSRRARRAFELRAAADDLALADRLRRAGVDEVEVVTGESYLPALMNLFRRRERRR
ncbi:MAG: DUF58 domain-containing protein [Phycisphaerales bacterium]